MKKIDQMPHDLYALRFPIGEWIAPDSFDLNQIFSQIDQLEAFPQLLQMELCNLQESDLVKTYRPGSWNISQLVHHLADSHMNGYIRHKLTLTEDFPVIKPYLEHLWADFPDAQSIHISGSLRIIEEVHKRWVSCLRSLSQDQWQRKYFHPESKKEFPLFSSLSLYIWHGLHHLAHIRIAKNSIK